MEGTVTEHLLPTIRAHLREETSSWLFHLFFASIVVAVVFGHPPDLFSGDTDTARNYLNTIVSSLSTILALCISIILVAIQMTAGNYTPRVLDFYVRLPYNVSLFLFYLATIMHSFFLMAQIRDPQNDPLPHNLDMEMSSDLVMVVICFLSLLLYMYAVVQLLKPERIIQLILREYRRSYQRGRQNAALANIEQICDIAKRAASFSDSVTGMYCVEVLQQLALNLPMGEQAGKRFMVHGNVIDQWVEIVGVAVKERETGVLAAALDALAAQGTAYVKAENWPIAERVVRAYRHLTFSHLITEGHVLHVDSVVARMYPLAAQASRVGPRGESFALRTWQVVRSIGETTVRAYPAAIPGIMSGFLLFNDFGVTVMNFRDQTERRQGVVCYFLLWRAFAEVANRRDIALWARWWQDAAPAEIQSQGMYLAEQLAVYLGRVDLQRTLAAIWRRELDDSTEAALAAILRPYRLDLFDGAAE